MSRHGRRETGSIRSPKCGKIRYATELDAKMALAFTRARDRGEQRYYHHTFCGGYHLTSETVRGDSREREHPTATAPQSLGGQKVV